METAAESHVPDGRGRRWFAMASCLFAGALACAPVRGRLVDGVYQKGPIAFRVGGLPRAWRRVQIGDGHLAFHHAAGGTILANASCDRFIDLSLEMLTSQLLYGVEGRRELARARLPIDGRAALRTRLQGSLDGVPIDLDLVVLKKDGCTYDLQLATSPRDFSARQPDFDRFLSAFAVAEVP